MTRERLDALLCETRARVIIWREQKKHLDETLDRIPETARARWATLDAQKKQLLLVWAFYVAFYALDLGAALLKKRLGVKA